VLALKRLRPPQPVGQRFASLCDECADEFAKEDLALGTRSLAALVRELPLDDFSPAHSAILRECAARLDEFSAARIEYTLLALHTVRAALSV
jgi:hypothetical protein